ncbi:MAG: InlB B-repeat-containing protein, partial [Clostridia bacterium]|nr:InlB B-repeat-containing protein [Clostridia bacterium]
YDAAVANVAVPTRTGYTFNGYYTADEGGTQVFNNAGVYFDNTWTIDSDVTYYAQWTVNTYIIELDLVEDGTSYGVADIVTLPATEVEYEEHTYYLDTTTGYLYNNDHTFAGLIEVTYDAAVANVAVPTRTGYTFNGYYTADEGGTQVFNNAGVYFDNAWTIDSDVTYYAQWEINQYTVNVVGKYKEATGATTLGELTVDNNNYIAYYYADASEHNVGTGKSYAYGTTVTIEVVLDEVSVGTMTFIGWFDNAACTGTPVATTLTYTFTLGAGDVTYYAYCLPERVAVSVDTYYQTATNATTLGEMTEGTTGGTALITSAVFTSDDDNTFTTATNVTSGYIYVAYVAYTAQATPATGYEFAGWYYGPALTQWGIDNPMSVSPAHIHALFVPQQVELDVKPYHKEGVAITAGADGNTAAITSNVISGTTNSVYYGYGWTVTATATTGYGFDGFYTDSTFVTKYTTAGDVTVNGNVITFANATTDQDVYVLFAKNEYTVSVSSKYETAQDASTLSAALSTGTTGGTATTSVEHPLHDISVTLTATPNAGYTFVGWYNTSDVLVYASTDCTLNAGVYTKTFDATGDVTLYARFNLNTYTLNLVSKQQTATSAITLGVIGDFASPVALVGAGVYYPEQNVTISAPAAEGYTFAGWYTDASCTSAVAQNDVTEYPGGVETVMTYTYSSNPYKYAGAAIGGASSVTLYAKYVSTQYTVTITDTYKTAASKNTLDAAQTGTTGGTIAFVDTTNSAVIDGDSSNGVYSLENGVYTLKIYHGRGFEMTATANSGNHYVFVEWSVVPSVTNASYTVNNVTANGSYTALFQTATYQVTASPLTYEATSPFTLGVATNASQGGSVTSGNFYYYGSGFAPAASNTGVTANLTASANTDYNFVGWFSDSTCETAVTNISDATTVYALFRPETYTITADANGGTFATALENWTITTTTDTDDTATAHPYKTWTGDITLPTATRPDYVFVDFIKSETSTTVTSLNIASVAAKNDITIEASWLEARKGNVIAINRTPESMYGAAIVTEALAGGNKSFGTNTSTVSDIANVSAESVTGYTFAGWYKVSTSSDYDITYGSGAGTVYLKALTANSPYTFASSYTNANLGTEWGSNIVLYAYYEPQGTTVYVDNYYLGANGNVGRGTTAGTAGVTIGSTSVALTANPGKTGQYQFTAYYGGQYSFAGTPQTNYELIGFTTGLGETAPTMAGAAEHATLTGLTLYGSSTISNVQAVFAGVEITVSFDANIPSGETASITMPSSITARYGTTQSVTLGYYAFDITYWQNIGFATSAAATSTTPGFIARINSGANTTFTFTVPAPTTTTPSNTVTLYAIWERPNVWVTDGSNFVGAYDTLEDAYTAIDADSGVTTAVVTILNNLTVTGSVSITKGSSITALNPATTLTFASESSASITATTTNIYGLTLSGNIGFNVASGKTLNIGQAGVATTINAVDSKGITATTKSIFKVDGGTIKIENATINNGVVGAAGGFGGIVSASNGASVTLKDSIFINNTSYARQLFYVSGSTTTMTISGCKFGIEADGTTAGYNIVNSGSTEDPEDPSTFAALFVVDSAATLTIGSSTDTNATEIATNGYRLVVSTGNSTNVSLYATVDSVLTTEVEEENE